MAADPPTGWTTEAVYGPAELKPYFEGLDFRPTTLGGLVASGSGADVIHAHGITAGSVALRPSRPPVVLSLHVIVGATGMTSRSRFARLAARFITRRADAVIAVSRSALAGVDDAHVIPPAFEPLPAPTRDRDGVRAELGATADEVVAITVSRLDSSKRLDLFIHAVEAAGCSGWLVGDGPERERLTALTRGSRVKLLGYRTDVSELLAAADVFVQPSAAESYGIAVAEALDAGLPVVATRTGAIQELVGQRGVVTSPDDEDGFVAAVVSIVADPGERDRLTHAQTTGARQHSAALIEALGRVYDSVARSG